ncbi:MAG: LysM peptidoglycan-binding domain-containing protein [Candidatus Xenobiia bacterium LiM19]
MASEDNDELIESTERPSKDDILRSKFIERNFEKILRLLREPKKPDLKDFIIIGLLLVIIVIVIFKPSGGMSPAYMENQQETGKKIDALTRKVDHLEKQLLAVAGIDDSYQVIKDEDLGDVADESPTPTPEKTETKKPAEHPQKTATAKPTSAKTEKPSASPSPAASKAAEPKSGHGVMVRKHTVKPGDTLSVICIHYYKTQDPSIISAVGRFNKLKGPNYDLYPGEAVKLPPKEMLLKKKKPQAGK